MTFVGQLHRLPAAPVACRVVLLDHSRNSIDVEAGETTNLPERNELERLPGSALGVRPGREAHRVLDEPADGRRFLRRTGFELLEDLVVDGDRRSHDAAESPRVVIAISMRSKKGPLPTFR